MTPKDSEMLFWAFRYCLGRMTYAVSSFCEYATTNIREIERHELELMDKEITEAQEWDDEHCDLPYHKFGMDCDRRDWLKLREVIRGELKRREDSK